MAKPKPLNTTKKKSGRRKLRPWVKFLIFSSFLAVVCFSFSYVKTFISEKISIFTEEEINLKTLEVPDYVDVDLINIGLARTGTKLKKVNNIVIHYTGNPHSTAKNNRDYFAKANTTVCSHFVVGLEGEIIQCVPLDEKSAASNNRNIDTISIEVCHPDAGGKYNEKTYDSLIKLVAWLCQNSDLTEKDVIRHYDITGKICPKYYVENENAWENLKADIKAELNK